MRDSITAHIEVRRRFISDAFHTLNQPLTGLHCELEIALQKPRTEGEYRQRIGEGIENAGSILSLIRAVRELVEAVDPGERYGTLSLALLLSQLKSELEVIAETALVGVEIDCQESVNLLADPGKLLAALGSLASGEMGAYEPGAQMKIDVKPGQRTMVITMSTHGTRRKFADHEQSTDAKVTQIRRNAAYSYLWTLQGDFELTDQGIKINLPRAVAKKSHELAVG